MRRSPNLERCFRYLLAWAPVAVPATAARAQRAIPTSVLRSGTLSFLGHATVGSFIGKTSIVSGAITGGSDYATTRGWVEAPTASLVTGNARRDRDLRSSMETDRYPTMRFELSGGQVVSTSSSVASDSTTLLLQGTFVIHGVTRRVELPATVVRTGDTTHVTAAFPLDLHDYAIGGLTKMFGMLRMEREIEVRVDLLFVNGVTIPPSNP